MQLMDLETKILKKYNIPLSSINRPIHYRIPEFYLTKNNTCLSFDKQSSSNLKQKNILSSPILYRTITKEREKNTLIRKQKIQKAKIDLLISETYDKINNKIRLKNEYFPKINSESNLHFISKYLKEKYKNNLMSNKVLIHPLSPQKKDCYLNKQYLWSSKFLEYIKMEKYKKIYRIKHINIHCSIGDIVKNNINKKSYIKNIFAPNITKFNPTLSVKKIKSKHERSSKIFIPINNIIDNENKSIENNSFYNTHLEKFTPIKSVKNNKKW